jgi:formate dehydrogenase major subunit
MTGDHSHQPTTLSSCDGVVQAIFIFGQNPTVGSANSELVEHGLSRLAWLVIRDSFEIETANFWKKGRRVQRGEIQPQEASVPNYQFCN